MVNIVVPFPDDLRSQAEAAAREQGLSLDEFVRNCVSRSVAPNRASDPLFADTAVFTGEAPADLAQNHDHYLYETDK
jgi:hypothetical protein